MRVRPSFWFFIAFMCTGILDFAAMVKILVSASLHLQLVQRPSAETPMILKVHVTDSQG